MILAAPEAHRCPGKTTEPTGKGRQPMADLPDVDAVIRLMREVAAAEILPRFRRLGAGDVSEKGGPKDLVTVADLESERRLTQELTALVPGSIVVGEEVCESDTGRIAALAGTAPVWLVDPVDGTNNFVRGDPCFAVIVGYCVRGETLAGWILDPLRDEVVWARRGGGAWRGSANAAERLRIGPAQALPAMCGSLGARLAQRVRGRREAGFSDVPARIIRLGCTGREYMNLATGTLDFACYTRLKPWDHAAGVLIHAEAGGWSRLVEVDRPYRPAPAIMPETLLLAPDQASGLALEAAFAAHGLGAPA